jgi:hypothetical protein
MARDIKKEMMELLGGEFLDWYSNLNDEEKQQYKIEFNKLQDNDIPHSDIRRMESEGVYEEKFSSKIPQWTQSHTGAAEHGIFFNDEWNENPSYTFDESHALDEVLNDMVKDMDIQDFEDDEAYEDGVDERPIKKDVEYNDDEFDY